MGTAQPNIAQIRHRRSAQMLSKALLHERLRDNAPRSMASSTANPLLLSLISIAVRIAHQTPPSLQAARYVAITSD